MKRNGRQGPLVAILLNILKGPRVTSFMIPQLRQFFRQEMLILWGCWVCGGEMVTDFVFDEEYFKIPPIVINNDQGSIPAINQGDQDNVVSPSQG